MCLVRLNQAKKLALLEDEESRKALLTIIHNGSTLTWHYVNLHGEYDFTQDIEEQYVVRYGQNIST